MVHCNHDFIELMHQTVVFTIGLQEKCRLTFFTMKSRSPYHYLTLLLRISEEGERLDSATKHYYTVDLYFYRIGTLSSCDHCWKDGQGATAQLLRIPS